MAELFFTSSALILAVLLVRAVLGRRMDARVRYGLWLLVLLRLLVPVSWGQSAVSPANLAHVPAPAAVVSPTVPTAATPPVTPAAVPAEPFSPSTAVESPPVVVPADTISREIVLPRLWIAGMAALAAWFVLCNLLFWRRLRKTRRLLTDGRVRVYAAQVTTPCLFGLFRPAVYVTEAAAADPAVLPYVLLHEKTHLRHGDQIWAFLRTICLVLWWFHPLVWVAALASRRDCELCCDASVIRMVGPERRGDYGRTLLQLAGASPPKTALCTVSTLSGSKRQLKSRIRAIARWAKPRAWAMAAALILALIAAACAFSGAKTSEAEPETPVASAQDAEAALDALEASFHQTAEGLTLTVPADYDLADWLVSLVGGDELDPAELDAAGWTPGETYTIHLPQGAFLTVTAEIPGAARRQWTFTGGEPDAEAALDALGASIQVDADMARFTIPAGDWDWELHLYGRAVYEDGMSMSIHPLEEITDWTSGQTYEVPLAGVTELQMLASLPGAAAREWTLCAGLALEDALQAVVEGRDDDAAWTLIRNNRLDVCALVFSDLLDHPGALDGLPWDDPSPLSIRFRVMSGLLGGADMPLETDTMGEWWDEYCDLACRIYDWQSDVLEGEDMVIPWQLAQMIYARRPAITDEQLVTSDGVRLNDTQQTFYDLLGIDEPADDYPIGSHWTYWHGNVHYTFYPGSGRQSHLMLVSASEDWGGEMPLGIRQGDSLDSVLQKLGVPAGQRPARTIYGGPGGTAYYEVGGDGLHRVVVLTASGSTMEVAFDRQDRVNFINLTCGLLNRQSEIWNAWIQYVDRPAGAVLQDYTWADDDAYGLYGAIAYDNPDNGSVGIAFCLRDDAGGLYFYPAEIEHQSYAGRYLHYLGDGAVGFWTQDEAGAYWDTTLAYHAEGNDVTFTVDAQPIPPDHPYLGGG